MHPALLGPAFLVAVAQVFDYLNIKVSPSEVKDMFNRVDLDGSGAIPVEEFVQALMNIADS